MRIPKFRTENNVPIVETCTQKNIYDASFIKRMWKGATVSIDVACNAFSIFLELPPAHCGVPTGEIQQTHHWFGGRVCLTCFGGNFWLLSA